MNNIISRTPKFFAKTALAAALAAALWTSTAPAQWSDEQQQSFVNTFF